MAAMAPSRQQQQQRRLGMSAQSHRCQIRGAATLSTIAAEQVVGLATFEQRIGRERDAMAQRRQRDALDVVGRHEIAAFEQCDGARAAHQRQRAARAGALREPRPVARGAREAHRVVDDLPIDALARGDLLQARAPRAR